MHAVTENIYPPALQKEVRFVSRMKFRTASNLGNCGLTHRTEHSEQANISDDHGLINVIHWMQEVG